MINQTNLIQDNLVVGLKLVSGEEIIGKITTSTKSDLFMDKIRLIHLSEKGQPILMGYAIFADDEMPQQINRNTIAAVFKPQDVYHEFYLEAIEPEKKVFAPEKPGIIV